MSDLVSQSELAIGLEAGSAAENSAKAASPDSDLGKMYSKAFLTGFCDHNVEAIKSGEFAQTCTELESKVCLIIPFFSSLFSKYIFLHFFTTHAKSIFFIRPFCLLILVSPGHAIFMLRERVGCGF